MKSQDAQIEKLLSKLKKLFDQQKHLKVIELIKKQKPAVRKHYWVKKFYCIALINAKKFSDALPLLIELDVMSANQPDTHYYLALCYKYCLRYEEGIKHAENAVQLKTKDSQYRRLLSELYMKNEQRLEAVVNLKQAAAAEPKNPDVICDLANCLIDINELPEAIDYLNSIVPSDRSRLLKLDAAMKLQRYGQAKEIASELLKVINCRDIQSCITLIKYLKQLGEFDLAKHFFSKLPKSNHQLYMLALLESGFLDRTQLDEAGIALRQNEGLGKKDKYQFFHALSEQYFRLNDSEKGFEYLGLCKQNALLTRTYYQDVDDTFTRIQDYFTNNTIPDFSGFKSQLPIFIVGMPRSGTTLLENILASHSEIFGAGETPYLRQALNGQYAKRSRHVAIVEYLDRLHSWKEEDFENAASYYLKHLRHFNDSSSRIVDKMPHNFLHLGMIKTLFPNAKVIHLRRNPIACCLSIYKQDFGAFHAYGNDLSYLASYYKKYESLMTFWKMKLGETSFIEVNYEDLILDTKNAVTDVLEQLGVEFEQNCLEFYSGERIVRTASQAQVRSQLYQSSIAPWLGIEHHIHPLIDAFPDAARAKH